MKVWAKHRKKVLAAIGTLVLGVLAVVAGGVYFLGSDDFRVLAANNIVRLIEDRTGMTVSLERFEIDFLDQSFSLAGLVLRGDEDPSDPPLLTIDRVNVGLRWRALVRRQVDLRRLEIVRPRLRLEIADDGATNVPTPPERPGGGPSGFEVAIGDLIVAGGELFFNAQRIDADFRLSDLAGSFDYAEATRVLSGHVEYAGTVARYDREQIPYEMSVDFDYTGGVVLVQSMALGSGPSRLQLQGRVDDALRGFRGSLEYTGTVALPFMNYFWPDKAFAGDMEVAGALDFSTAHFAARGRMTSERLAFDEWSGANLSSNYTYAFPERVLRAEDFDADVFGGHASGDLGVLPLPGPSRVELDLDFRDIGAADLRAIYPWGPGTVLDSVAAGTMEGWFRGSFDDFDLAGEVEFRPSGRVTRTAEVSLPVFGSTRYHGVPGQVEVEDLDGGFRQTRIEGAGLVRAEDFLLEVRMVSDELRDLAFLNPDVNGTGAFDGVLNGRLARPDAAGTFMLEAYDYEGWVLDRIGGRVDFTGERVTLDAVGVDEGESRVVLDGEFDLGTGQPNLDVEIVALDPTDIPERFNPYPVSGALRGRLHVDSIEPVVANGTLNGSGLFFGGQEIGSAEAEVTRRGERFELRNARVRRGESLLAGDLDFNRESSELHLDLEASGQRITELRWLGVPDQFQGVVNTARFVVDGTPDSPLIAGEAVIDGLQFRQQFFERATVRVNHDSRLVTAEVTAGERLTIGLELDTFATGFPFEGDARFTNYDASEMTGMDPGTVVATGTARFEGQLTDFETLEGAGEVLEFRARLEDDEIVAPPFTFEFDTEEVRLSNVDLSDERTSITVDGTVSLAPEAPLDLTVLGELDLSLLSSRFIDLEVSGSLTVRGNIVGVLSNPELDGRATLNDVTIVHPSVFLGLSGLNGEMAFDRDRVNLIDIVGGAGGGRVSLGGTIAVAGIRPADMDLQVTASEVRLRTPEGLRTVFDATLSLRGTPEAPSLEGNVDLLSLSFRESFEEFLALFDASAGGGLPSDPGPLDALTFAVHVQGERDVHIENELVRVDARLDLDIGGTFAQPTMTGHVESVDGVLDLQGNRYLITRGNVDFVDPVGIEPRIDVQAETDLRDYRVILTLTGTPDSIRMDMTSDPPLPQLEIVSLMTGGRTREELAGNNAGALPTSEELFQGAAASVVTDLLQERVGSRFGLGSLVRIDPFLVGAENDPVARVTVSEQVTRDLIITYSQDLSSNRQEIILIEYFLDNNTSFIASRDETGAVGLDIRLRKRFR